MTDLLTSPDQGPNGQIRRDRWGRYLLPHPETGKEQAWTRVTTLSSTLADRFGLEKWMQRNIVYGIGQRQDLYARAAAAKLEDKDTLTQIVDAAQAAAADKAGANLGSAIHQFTERIDRGEALTVPAPYDKDIVAYLAAIDAADIAVVVGWVEKVVCIPELEVVGTLDRLVEGPWVPAKPRIADVKTGKDVVRYGMTEIALQLALYAHASYWWTGNGWQPMNAPIDQDKGIVIHLPVGQGTCTLYEVDLQAGWDAVRLAVDVRAWRKRKDLAQQIPAVGAPASARQVVEFEDDDPTDLKRIRVVPAPPEPEIPAIPPAVRVTGSGTPDTTDNPPPAVSGDRDHPPAAQIQWLRARVGWLIDHGYGGQLAAQWSRHPDIPTFKHGGPQTTQHVDAIIAMCGTVEDAHGLPFGPSDPTMQPTTKAKARAQA
jgi:hypothetical protein